MICDTSCSTSCGLSNMGMKVLKKIRRNFRCGARNSLGTNNLTPIQFHATHSENIRLSRDQAVSRRVESFCKGISFSNRPIRINEKIYLKVVETSVSWSGVLRFGLTSNDPSNTRGSTLPKYTCPDMTNKPGNWGKALAERYAQRDYILFFYVTPSGDVHYGVNAEEKGVFFDGVDVSNPLWALIDVYGNTIAIEILNTYGNNRNNQSDELDSLSTSMSVMNIDENAYAPCRYHRSQNFNPMTFHPAIKGLNMSLTTDYNVASRRTNEYSQGYVFTERSLRINETFVIQVLQTDPAYSGSLAFGLTSCDPSRVSPRELPEDSDNLLDRSEYWVVTKDVAGTLTRGDELAFRITRNGEVKFQKNNLAPVTIMHVDHSLRLWAFLNVYGSTTKVRSLGSYYRKSSRASNSTSRANNSNQNNQASLVPSIQASMNSNDGPREITSRSECAVCYERQVDSVLYTCGHMCMCYECAVQQWRNSGAGLCPICRAYIRDVIRIFKS